MKFPRLEGSISWSVQRYLRTSLHQYRQLLLPQLVNGVNQTITTTASNLTSPGRHVGSPSASSKDIRHTFINYFRDQEHEYVHSSPVIPKKDEGTYFVNAGMNQFKPIFLGTIDPQAEMARYRRVVNSQKCIRVGGKHNDLDDVGKDTYHHTFFEMLGNWSFADYFKKEACSMAWDLLTEVYRLPQERLYVTYFAGDKKLGLKADTESRDIWLYLGVPPDKVLPFGMSDNFWDMGDTGPCGPCTEIHYDHIGERNAAELVNCGSPDVIELWNLVFMQHERHQDGSLCSLPKHHVDTGLGLERLTAVLQGKKSNYDTDLFQPLFKTLNQWSKCGPYRGRFGSTDVGGIDTAYRVVADHMRMITAAVADGLIPGRRDLEHKLRQILHRCAKYCDQVLQAPPGTISKLVPVVVDSLGEAFPEIAKHPSEIQEIVNITEEKYLGNIVTAHKVLHKALRKYGNPTTLTAPQIFEIQEGRFGKHVPVDILADVCEDVGLHLDMVGYEELKQEQQSRPSTVVRQTGVQLTQQLLDQLNHRNIPGTQDQYKYHYSMQDGTGADMVGCHVLALVCGGQLVDSVPQGEECGVLLDKTCFYAEGGGQRPDLGHVTSTVGEVSITDVQSASKYVIHIGRVTAGSIKVGDHVHIGIDQDVRESHTRNHTATHVLNYALGKVIGQVRQQGSLVAMDKLTFDFTCLNSSITDEEIDTIAVVANEVIHNSLPVYMKEIPLKQAQQIQGVCFLQNEVYPSDVRVVSIGAAVDDLLGDPACDLGLQHSVELCGGTHVNNTKEISSVVITNFHGVAQGTKRLTAVTGDQAQEAMMEMRRIEKQLDSVIQQVEGGKDTDSMLELAYQIEKSLSDGTVLPKVAREAAQATLNQLGRRINQHRNKSAKVRLQEALESLLQHSGPNKAIVDVMKIEQPRQVLDTLVTMAPSVPIMLFSPSPAKDKTGGAILGICYVPDDGTYDKLEAGAWSNHICSFVAGSSKKPGGKYGKTSTFRTLSLKKKSDLDTALHLARTYAALCQND